MAIPKGISNHPGVERVVPGDDQGSDRKYWVFPLLHSICKYLRPRLRAAVF